MSGWIQGILIVATASLLGSCASTPSGHYRFALFEGKESADWSLKSLPHHGRMRLVARVTAPASPDRAAEVRVNFGVKDTPFPLARLEMVDPGCKGAYSFSLEYGTEASASAIEYFDHDLPWSKLLKIQAEWWPDRRMQIEIDGVGGGTVQLRHTFDTLEIKVTSGRLDVDDLDFENLEST